MVKFIFIGLIISIINIFGCNAQNMVTYAGGPGKESFNDVIQISNGHIIVIGVADDLNWVPTSATIIEWQNPGISNNLGTNRIPFIIEFDDTLQNLLAVYHLPVNAAEDFKFIKTTNVPGQPTGDIFISGTTEDTVTGGYFIGKLNNNFITGIPTGFLWVENIKAKAGQNVKIYQPWDVGNDGKVVYAYGDSHDYNWSAIYRLKADGSDDVVPFWRVHWSINNSEFYGYASTYPAEISELAYSAIVFKRDANRCELRSTNQTDFDTWLPDGNGGMKKGKWPLDVLFNSPCNPGQSGNTTSGPGYTGYSPPNTTTYGPSSICIDRRNNFMYIGFNAKSILSSGLPDFEPAVMAMNNEGLLLWWSRLYHEVTPNGDFTNSSPDQYIDAIAIDYSLPLNTGGGIVVSARCHGNNIENLWEGNTIASNTNASGFQNQFTGTAGDIHISWLGKLKSTDATLLNSTYVAEYSNFTTGLGTPHSDPNLNNWPNPNSGWPNVNTTYLGKNMLKVTANGSVIVLGKGRRTITTTNAFQNMIKQTEGNSCWNDFVRQYSSTFDKPLYSSILVGQWDTSTQMGGDNVRLNGMFKTSNGIIVVGKHTGIPNDMPVNNIPIWGTSTFNNESAVLAYFQASNIVNPNDSPIVPSLGITNLLQKSKLIIYPNPANDYFTIECNSLEFLGSITIYNSLGQIVYNSPHLNETKKQLNSRDFSPGVYFVHSNFEKRVEMVRLIIY